jgi:transglutaminase-like putative cysteine protease
MRLTENASTDKEKFDLLFRWVASNIEYDRKKYMSTRGNSIPNIKNILRRKKGVCLDYTYLMDSLCYQVGIQNVTVVGI